LCQYVELRVVKFGINNGVVGGIAVNLTNIGIVGFEKKNEIW